LVRSPGLNASPNCAPDAEGDATIVQFGPVEVLSVKVQGLPPKTDFDFFVIQVPNKPFGMSWYQGDIETNDEGKGRGIFVGRFRIETFVVAPDSTDAPLTFEGSNPSVSPNLKTGPIQMYHLGLWFNSPEDAVNAGCPAGHTPFNGEHDAGPQVLNTGNSRIWRDRYQRSVAAIMQADPLRVGLYLPSRSLSPEPEGDTTSRPPAHGPLSERPFAK